MALPYYEFDVPIRNTTGLRGVHVFTGPGDWPASRIGAWR
ncbi:hypothetical protein GCM10010317_100540 [Streptomyces mirabilis]|jgi:hypothetical protein|nr:hypothetical protein GCM10010317_100540 [Streptomyces mirabilis]